MNSKEFLRRRKQLMSMVGEGGIAILPAAPVRTRTRDIEHRYRQDSDFYYLTGFAEPDAVAVLTRQAGHNGEYLLFCRERDKEKERWDGSRARARTAQSSLHGADDAFPIDDIDDILARHHGIVHRASTTRWACTPEFDSTHHRLGEITARCASRAVSTRRRSSLLSTISFTTCGCTRVARKSQLCGRPPRWRHNAHKRAMQFVQARPDGIRGGSGVHSRVPAATMRGYPTARSSDPWRQQLHLALRGQQRRTEGR